VRVSDRILSDSSKYSRNNLADAVYGQEFVLRREALEAGSQAMLKTLWREHGPILAYLDRHGSGSVERINHNAVVRR
jgi:hypothetical protein